MSKIMPMAAGVCAMAALVAAQNAFAPARYRVGSVPMLPPMMMAVGGGEVLLEVSVDRDGRVSGVATLRATPPFTDIVASAVRGWSFRPAEEADATEGSRHPVDSTVLVAAVFRPPALHGPTLGELPRDVAAPLPETPMPLVGNLPPFPAVAAGPGVVLVEARVESTGSVSDVRVVRSAPPFDQAAVAAAEQWSFRPARVRGRPVAVFVYVMFGFPTPVGIGPRPAP